MTRKDFKSWRSALLTRCDELLPQRPEKPKGAVYRFAEIDHTRAQDDSRTVEAILSTESPVQRRGYTEVLRHTPEACDLSRAESGLPLLWSHDQKQQIGVAENVRIYDSSLRARLRFSKNPEAERIWQDIKDGIVRGISIGYHVEQVEEAQEADGRFVLTATRWMPFESSAVSVPADIRARIGRSLDLGLHAERPEALRTLELQRDLIREYDTTRWVMEDIPESSNQLRREIEEVEQRLMAATTPEDVAACQDLIRSLNEAAEQLDDPSHVNGINISASMGRRSNAMQEFSLCRALAMTFDPNAAKAGGPEYEIMQDAARQRGKSLGDRYTMPESVLFRSVTKGGDGGNLIATSHMSSLFIPALRERLISGRMGANILPGLTSDIQIPRQTADSTAGWLAGDGSDQVPASDPSYDKITMKPTSVGCSSTISRKMLLQGDPASEKLVQDSLAFAVAKALDAAAINGSGSSNQPLGILGQANVGSNTYANGGAPSFGDIVDLEGELMVDDADMGNLGYVTTGAIAATMKKTEVVATTGQMIWTATDQGEGRMNGYRALTSNLIPAGHVLFGNWSDLLIALWSGLDFVVDPYSRASYGDVVITVFMDCDIAVRHGESFAELHEAAP